MFNKITLLLFSLLIIGSAHAEFELGNNEGSRVSFSAAAGYYQYKEPEIKPIPMSIKGPSLSLDLDYQYTYTNNIVLMLNSDFGFVYGKYDGSTRDRNTGVVTPLSYNGDNSFILGISPRLGYQFYLPKYSFRLLQFIGLGYRYLHNDSSDITGGYLRQSNYFYLSVGFIFEYEYQQWLWQSEIEFNNLIQGIQYSGAYGGVTNKQDSGFGINGNILMGRNTGHVTWLIGPYIKYWNIKDSDHVSNAHVTGAHEPANNTLDIGLMLRFIFLTVIPN